MASFSAVFTDGVALEPWEDPADGAPPTRINATADHAHARWVGETGTQVEITVTQGGVEAPADGADLFIGSAIEWPGASPPPTFSSPLGQSSIQRFTPAVVGHYTVRVKQENGGGAVILHVDVDT